MGAYIKYLLSITLFAESTKLKVMKSFKIKRVVNEGWGNSKREYLEDGISFHIHENFWGTHCYVRAIGMGRYGNLVIDIPFSSEIESREVYYHFLTFEKNGEDSILSYSQQEEILKRLGFEFESKGRSAYKIITTNEEVPKIDGTEVYMDSRKAKEITTIVHYDEQDILNVLDEARKHRQQSILYYNRINFIGNLPE